MNISTLVSTAITSIENGHDVYSRAEVLLILRDLSSAANEAEDNFIPRRAADEEKAQLIELTFDAIRMQCKDFDWDEMAEVEIGRDRQIMVDINARDIAEELIAAVKDAISYEEPISQD